MDKRLNWVYAERNDKYLKRSTPKVVEGNHITLTRGLPL